MSRKILIIGGTSGLGWELARIYDGLGHTVFITGRKTPNLEGTSIRFFPLSIGESTAGIPAALDSLVGSINDTINTLVYCAGFYQEGTIDALTDGQIEQMVSIGILVPALLIRRLKNHPGNPLKVMLITSTSQFTPRLLEPVYCATKAALGALGESLALDPELGKVVVAAPAGMDTPFWSSERNTEGFLDPHWVAEQIRDFSGGPFKYRFIKIMRGPARVEVVETRP